MFVDWLQHDIGRDGAFNPFTENDLHSVYILYDTSSKEVAEQTADELAGVFLGQLGVILVNV